MRFASLNLMSFALVVIVFFGFSQWASGPTTSMAPVITATEILAFQHGHVDLNDFVVVDVRSEAETDVSMIPGALTKSEFERTLDQHQDKTVIVYCTIGVRSGKYAALLNGKGWTAWNYKGSILDWCGNDLPLMANGRQTNQVHTYSQWYSAPEHYIGVL